MENSVFNVVRSQSLRSQGETRWQTLLSQCPHIEELSVDQKSMIFLGIATSDYVWHQLENSLTSTEELLPPQLPPNYAKVVSDALAKVTDENDLDTRLRQIRNQFMTQIALGCLNNKVDIEHSYVNLSELADALIHQTYLWWYKQLQQRMGTPYTKDGNKAHMLIIAMGKLGGKELNFSSDVDLIFSYTEDGETQGGRKTYSNQEFFTRLGRKLIASLDRVNQFGFVYRVDMRLRPFGDSGPLAISLSAMEDYYQLHGREWERYALIKARVLGDDESRKEGFYRLIRPFVFRRYIDFGVIEALREMKRMIRQEVRRRQLQNNIKLSSGGIREAEFIVQSFQLIRGGRDLHLQAKSFIQVLRYLGESQVLTRRGAQKIEHAYLFLRKVEHLIQEFADQQTQELPQSDGDKEKLAELMGFQNVEEFNRALQQHQSEIAKEFNDLVELEAEEDNETHDSTFEELWNLELSVEEVVDLIEQLTPVARQSAEVIVSFKGDIEKKSVGQRGRRLLSALMPVIMECVFQDFGKFADFTLKRLFTVLHKIVGRTAYLELLQENRGALHQLIKLCKESPWIAETLSRYPLLLDELIDPKLLYEIKPLENYAQDLRTFLLRIPEDDLENQMEALRHYKHINQLHVAAADVTGVMPVMKVSDHLTYLAEAIIAEVVAISWQQMVRKHGYPQGYNGRDDKFGVIAFGKLGGIELGYGSDLDLVFVHNSELKGTTDGPKPLDTGTFYIKLAQRIIHIFTTRTNSGILYDVDMRLRPSGDSGLLACHIETFREYQTNNAWTWEHQALVRSRMVYGSSELRAHYQKVRREILELPRDIQKLLQDVVDMRQKMKGHLNKSNDERFDIKQGDGGVVDIEFLTQYLVLANSHQQSDMSFWSDNVRIIETAAQSGLLTPEQSQQLINSYCEYRDQSHRCALQQRDNLIKSKFFLDERAQVIKLWQQLMPLPPEETSKATVD